MKSNFNGNTKVLKNSNFAENTKVLKNKSNLDENTKILFISSTGGHFAELMKLKPLMDKCNYHIVTEKTATNKDLKQKFKNKLDFLVYGTRKTKLLYPFVLLINSFLSLFIYLKFRPKIVITTGTHTAGPMCCIAKIFGGKVIYIETLANRTSKTATRQAFIPYCRYICCTMGRNA